ncbi:MAG TPA: hypothetical protein DEB71_00885 [Chryseobacterium carnipullorum]|nr:hypothetical protein [Chryseobacterium carnipullorum]
MNRCYRSLWSSTSHQI